MAKKKVEGEETKKSKFEIAIETLEKDYGAGTTIIMNEDTITEDINVISTGSYGLDIATGIGGIPRGRITQIVGPESVGKTTLASHIIANAQKLGKAVFMDVEHSFDLAYAQKIGVKKEGLIFAQPSCGEESFDIIKRLAATGEVSAIVLDSIASNIPKEQHEGETGQSRMARLAALNSLEIPKLIPILHKSDTALILLNQLRSNIGGYGQADAPAGGNALKYYCSMIIDLRKEVQKEDERNLTKAKVAKNKCASPFKTCEFYIDWGLGINSYNEILNFAVNYGIIKKAGSWFSYKDTNIAQGSIQADEFLRDNPEVFEEIKNLITEKQKEDGTIQ